MKKTVISLILLCLIALPKLSSAAHMPDPVIEQRPPNFVLDHFPTGHDNITDEMLPKLNHIAGKEMVTNSQIWLQGWVSEPPCFGENCHTQSNFIKQKNLAQDRAYSVANWLISHGISSDRIRIFLYHGRGQRDFENNFRDQRVDVYIVPASTPVDVRTTIKVNCPEGYSPDYDIIQSEPVNGVVAVNVTTQCIIENQPITIIETQEDPCKDKNNPLRPRHCDATFYAYNATGLIGGCAVGYALSNMEPGKGGVAGDARGGDGGGICADDTTCIITGCLSGIAISETIYEIQRNAKWNKLQRAESHNSRTRRR